jgi:probable HAF family extracellular repeat protein
MKKLFLLPCFLVSLIGFCYAADVAYKFKTLDLTVTFNGTTDTLRIVDRNNKGEIIGHHFDDASYYVTPNHRTITRLDCGGDNTSASAINNVGQIAGACYDQTGANGFVHDRRTGNYTLLRYPGSDYTVAYGINDLGHVVGQYGGAAFGDGRHRFHAFVWKDGVYSTVDAPDPDQMNGALYAIARVRPSVIMSITSHQS